MGEFNAGKWIIGLSIYFFLFFLIVTSVISGLDEVGEDRDDLYVTDPGFILDGNQTVPGTVTNTDTVSWDNIRDSIGVMTGFNAQIGLPGTYQFIFSFIFFWIPLMMLLWALYMALPFLH